MNELAYLRLADGLFLVRRRQINNVHVLIDPVTGKRLVCEVNHKIRPMFVRDMAEWLDVDENGDELGFLERAKTWLRNRVLRGRARMEGPAMIRFFHRIQNGLIEQPIGQLEEGAERVTAHFVDVAVKTNNDGKPEVNVDGMDDVQEAMSAYGVPVKEQANYVNFLVMTQKFQHRLNFFVESILERLNPATMALSLIVGSFLFGILFGLDVSARTDFLELYTSSNWYYGVLGVTSLGLIAYGLRRRSQ